MDEDMMLEWIDLDWKPATKRKHLLLVFDSFSAHVTNDVKKQLNCIKINTVPLVILGGCYPRPQHRIFCERDVTDGEQMYEKYGLVHTAGVIVRMRIQFPRIWGVCSPFS